MDIGDALSAEWPAPRDDEPAGLRQDILDELADHLACSYNRELLRGAGPGEARQRAIERFGDPAAVARRLWLDAMRGRIMAQRVLLAACLVVTMASLSLAGVMWRQTAQAHRESAQAVADAVRLMADQNERAQAGQQELLKQLHEMSETIRSTRSLDWNPVAFQVKEEAADGPPAAGVAITLRERPTGGQNAAPPFELATRTTDRSGLADFGVVHPGEYTYEIWKNGEQGAATSFGQLKIEPGSQIRTRVVIPKVPPDRVPVRILTNWPDDLDREKLQLFASFTLNPIRRDDHTWTVTDERHPEPPTTVMRWWNAFQRPAIRSFLSGPRTSIVQLGTAREPYLWAPSLDRPVRKIWVDFRDSDRRELKEAGESIEWEQGSYRLSSLLVLRPDQAGARAGIRRFAVVAMSDTANRGQNGGAISVWQHPPDEDDIQDARPKSGRSARPPRKNAWADRPRPLNLGGSPGFPQVDPYLYPSVESWPKEVSDFVARPGRLNEWTIPLPPELIEAVRERLKPEPAPEKGKQE